MAARNSLEENRLQLNGIPIIAIWYCHSERMEDRMWFKVKTLTNALGDTDIFKTMRGVAMNDKMRYEQLCRKYGFPSDGHFMGFTRSTGPENTKDGKSWWVNEVGMLKVLLDSHSSVARNLYDFMQDTALPRIHSSLPVNRKRKLPDDHSVRKLLRTMQQRQLLLDRRQRVLSANLASALAAVQTALGQ